MDAITDEQKDFLNHFKCERLTSSKENMGLISHISNAKNDNLVFVVKQNGWNEDLSGDVAYYVVKNSENKIVMLFTLRTGIVFRPIDTSNLRQDITLQEAELSKLKNMKNQQRVVKYGSIEKYNVAIERRKKNKCNLKRKLRFYNVDASVEKNKCNHRVDSAFSGVELFILLRNENVQVEWKQLPVDKSFCVVLFWHFIAPIIIQLKKLVGCSYFYLFAADRTEDMTLVRYYEECFRFAFPFTEDNIGSVKPFFDLTCHFMYQKIEQLEISRRRFFDTFNSVQKESVV